VGPEKAAIYWKARALALEKRLDAERARLVALAAALPPESLELLDMDPEALEAARWAESAVTGIENTHTFVPSDVETELDRVWARLRLPEVGDV